MLNEKFNKNIIADAMRVLKGQTTEKKPIPQSLKDAAVSAAKDLRLLREGVMTIEGRRDTLRKHLNEGLKTCGCRPTVDLVTRFEEEVDEAMKAPVVPVEEAAGSPKPLATPSEVAKKTKNPTDGAKMPINTGLRGTKQPPKDIGEEIEKGLRDFVSALTEQEIEILGGILGEAAMAPKDLKNMKKAINDTYNKYFNRVQVDIFDLGKISKEIQSALTSGADLDKVMPDIVKKYRKN